MTIFPILCRLLLIFPIWDCDVIGGVLEVKGIGFSRFLLDGASKRESGGGPSTVSLI
jgi:hypothetical protein